MNVKVGALAEIATINEKGEIVLDTKGAVILNCGILPNVKIINQMDKKEASIDNEGFEIKPVSENPNVVDREKEEEKEKEEEQEKQEQNIKDDGADEMII